MIAADNLSRPRRRLARKWARGLKARITSQTGTTLERRNRYVRKYDDQMVVGRKCSPPAPHRTVALHSWHWRQRGRILWHLLLPLLDEEVAADPIFLLLNTAAVR